MAKISIGTTSDHVELDGIEGHYGTIEGYTVGFERYGKDDDPAPLFAGLPDDACQSPHWGVVLEGSLIFRYTDGRQDVIEAGEAYFAPPGHRPVFRAGTRVVEFSPADALARTMQVVMANVAALQGS
jgi:hypothetical protein